jgi:hypothetical protein
MALGENAGNLFKAIFEGKAYGEDQEDLSNLADDPRFNSRDYEKIGYAGDYSPGSYATPEAAQYQTVSEDPRTRDYQMQALSRMQQLADQSAGSAEALGRYNAVSDANSVAAQQNAGIRNQMAMRGQGGSGMEFVLQQQAAQNAANRAQSAGMNAAQQAALQRLMGTQGVMQGASNVRGMDANVAGRNADIINQFNMANTGARNAAAQGNVNMQNAAGLRNVEARQGLSGANAAIGNQGLNRSDVNRLAEMQARRQKFGMKSSNRHGEAQNIGSGVGAGVGLVGDFAQMAAGGMG